MLRETTLALFVSLLGIPVVALADFNEEIGFLLAEVDTLRLEETVLDLESYGTRFAAAAGQEEIALALYDSLRMRGWETQIEPFTFWQDTLGSVTTWNLIARREGTETDSLFIIGAHWDSIDEAPGGSWDNPEAPAPGAIDNASGVACLLELARILGNRTFRHSVEICLFGAEEVGLFGSQWHTLMLIWNGLDDRIIGYLNVDSIGHDQDNPYDPDSDYYCEYGCWDCDLYFDWWSNETGFLTDIATPIWDYTDLYARGRYAAWSNSDANSFWERGIVGISLWEGGDHAPYYNSGLDTYANNDFSLPFFAEMTRGAMAAFCVNAELDGYTPVTLTHFSLTASEAGLLARWQTGGELAAFRFEISGAGQTRIIPHRETAPSVFAAEDNSSLLAGGGEFIGTLYGMEGGGNWQPLRSESVTLLPAVAATGLLQPWPNPCNPQVTVPFALERSEAIRISIHDLAGRQVAILLDGEVSPGQDEVTWNGLDSGGLPAASGVYFVHMAGGGISDSRKLLLLR